MRKTLLIISLAMILSALASSAARAEGGKIRFGNLAIIPGLGLEEEYDDNIYYDKNNGESDWITHIQPQLLLDYTIEGRGKVKLGYKGDYASYSKNDANDWKNHKGLFDLNYVAPGGLIVKINNEYQRSEDPYGSDSQYNLGTKTKRWDDTLTCAVGFRFSERFKLFTFYNFYKESYEDKDINYAQDHYDSELGAGAEVKLTHKTWVFLRYHIGQRNYYTYRGNLTSSNDADYDWHRVNTGLVWDDGGRFGGEFNFGYQWNSFKNKYDMDGFSYEDKNSWIAATRIDYHQTEARLFRFTVRRSLQQYESGQSGYFMETTLGIMVLQRIRVKYEVGAGYEFETYNYTGPSKSHYSNSNPDIISDTLGTKNKIHRAHATFRYFVREWLTAGVRYEFEKNKTDISSVGYTSNRFMFTLDFIPASYH